MTRIDAHAHPYFRDWFPGEPEPGVNHEPPESWMEIVRRMHGTSLELPTFDVYRERMDAAGIDKTVVFVRDIETKNGEVPENEWVLSLADNYERFIPFFAVDPNKGEAGARALRRAVESGVKGVKIHPYGAKLYPNDERADPIYEAASDLDVPVISHTGPGPLGTKSDYCHPRHFDDVVTRFPNLSLILAHFSGPWHRETHFMAWRYDNVYVDISFMPDVYLDQLPWEYYAETIGDSILLGSDFPLVDPKERVDYVRALPIDDEVKQKILGENAVDLLGI